MRDAGDPARLLSIWTSTAFPIGAFAYSHGLEAAAARGLVRTRADVEAWLRDLVRLGSLRQDAILTAAAWRAAVVHDVPALAAINDLALALQPSAARHLETAQQGMAFTQIIAAAYPCAPIGAMVSWPTVALPVAIAAAAAGHAIGREPTVHAAGLGTLQNLMSAAVRLSLVGQTDAQRILAAVMPDVAALAAADLSLDDLGGGTVSSDLASLEHETLYSRLFRS
jgi:urease accessory protein